MFGTDLKYVLILGIIATFAYTNPLVLDSISSGIAYTNQQAAVGGLFDWFSGPPITIQSTNNLLQNYDNNRIIVKNRLSSTTEQSTTTYLNSNLGDKDFRKNILLNPQEVVTILFNAGIISSDNIDRARMIVAGEENASSTVGIVIHDDLKNRNGATSSLLYGASVSP